MSEQALMNIKCSISFHAAFLFGGDITGKLEFNQISKVLAGKKSS